MKVIISCYQGKYVVCEARTWDTCTVERFERVHRGYNLFGDDLGYQEKPVYKPARWTEGVALTAGLTLEAAREYVKLIGAVEVQPFQAVRHE